MTDEKGAWAESLCFGSGAGWGWEVLFPQQTRRQAAHFMHILPSLTGELSGRVSRGLFSSCNGSQRSAVRERTGFIKVFGRT